MYGAAILSSIKRKFYFKMSELLRGNKKCLTE